MTNKIFRYKKQIIFIAISTFVLLYYLSTSLNKFSYNENENEIVYIDHLVKNAVKSKKWQYIIIHHTGTDSGSLIEFRNYHKFEKGWEYVGYHFIINNGNTKPDGIIEGTERWKLQIEGAHSRKENINTKSIGIAIVGNFNESEPTKRQLQSLIILTRFLQRKFKIPKSRVLSHNMLQDTECPGRFFDFKLFTQNLE